MEHKIVINSPDEENQDVYIDGEKVGNFNHDDHGWRGMEAGIQVVNAIAAKLGIEVIYE